MLQLTIVTIALVVSSVYIKIDEVEKDKMWREYDKTDWNEYYKHN